MLRDCWQDTGPKTPPSLGGWAQTQVTRGTPTVGPARLILRSTRQRRQRIRMQLPIPSFRAPCSLASPKKVSRRRKYAYSSRDLNTGSDGRRTKRELDLHTCRSTRTGTGTDVHTGITNQQKNMYRLMIFCRPQVDLGILLVPVACYFHGMIYYSPSPPI